MTLATTIASLYLLSFLTVLVISRRDQLVHADAIVVLGAAQYNGRPSPVLQARLDHAAMLFQQGYADLLVVTGGIVAGDRMSEATAGQRYLVNSGIPARSVAVTPEGRNTASSMDAVAEYMDAQGLKTALLVSDPFHLARLRLEARRLGITAYTSPTATSPISTHFRTELSYLLAEAAKLPILVLRGFLQ